MSGRISRLLRQAGFLAVALAAARAVHGQDGERALRNQVSAPVPELASSDLPPVAVSGEQALLGHVGAAVPAALAFQVQLSASDTVAQAIDGARALMGHWATTETRRRIAVKNQ